jgi:hypothetical protein
MLSTKSTSFAIVRYNPCILHQKQRAFAAAVQ